SSDKEVKKKSVRDFHKTHPSGSGTIAEDPPRVAKITPIVTSEGTDDSNNEQESSDEGNEQENESEEQVSNSEQELKSKDDDQDEDEIIHTPSPTDDKDDDNLESESDDVSEGDKEIDDTTNQFDDDVDTRLKEHTQTDKEIVQGEGADTEMHDAQQGNENLETTQEQVVDDTHVTITTVAKKTEGPIASSSLSFDLASKFLNFSDIPQADAEIVSPLDVYVHHEVPRTEAPTLLLVPVSVIPESSPVFTNIPQSSHTFTPTPIQKTPTPPPTINITNPLSNLPDFASILPQEVSNFAPPVIEKLIKESRDEVTLGKVSSQPQSTYEAASTLTEFKLKKILLDKIEKSKSYLTAPEHRDCYDDKDKDEDPSAGSDRGLKKRKTSKDVKPTTGLKKKDSTSGSSKGTKSQPKSTGKSGQSEEPVFEVADSDMPQDQAGNLGDNEDEPRDETASRRDWFKKPTPPQEPTDPD
ncbi:hypothetical protein Tco_1291116, partial [Tanacetum coccineum]